jgi:hypothetical protein
MSSSFAAVISRIGRPALADRVEVDDRLGLLADQGFEHLAPVVRQPALREAVGAVGRVTEPCQLHLRRGAPFGQPPAHPQQVLEQRPAGMRLARRAVGREKFLDRGPVRVHVL